MIEILINQGLNLLNGNLKGVPLRIAIGPRDLEKRYG